MDEIIKGRVAIAVNETIHRHQARYSEELQQKLGDLNAAYTTSYGRAVVDVISAQVKVLEARMDTLRDLEEDMQKALEGVNYDCKQCGHVFAEER